MYILFFFLSIILFFVSIISLVISFIKHKAKKTSLIILGVSFVCFVISFMSAPAVPNNTQKVEGNTDTSITQQTSDEKEEIKDEVKPETYKIGDSINVSTSDGDYIFRIDAISETSERNQFSDIQADRVVIIDFSYENINMPENLYIFDSNFKAYDKDNNSLQTYPVSTTSGEQISAGRKTKGQMAFALNNQNNYIELEYYDNMYNDSRGCLIVIEW